MNELEKKQPEKPQKGSAQLPADYVRAEVNLESIGYFEASNKRRYAAAGEAKVIRLSAERTVRIVPSATYGYPNTEDLDFYRAFLKICDEQVHLVERRKGRSRTLHPHFDLPIRFSTGHLLRTAGRSENDHNWKAAKEWLKRNSFTGIEGAVRLEGREGRTAGAEFRGVLFQQSVTAGEELKSGAKAEVNHVWPSAWFLRNLFWHYVKPIDVALHQRLDSPIAKGLYPILDQGFYASGGKSFAKLYSDLAGVLAVPAFKHVSRIKQQLDRAHGELEREEFISSWEYRKAAEGDGIVVVYQPGPKYFRDQQAREERLATAASIAERGEPKGPPMRVLPPPPVLEPRAEGLLDDLVRELGDEKSRPYYSRLLQELNTDRVYALLSETRDAHRLGRIRTTKARYFTDLAERARGKKAADGAPEAVARS